MKGVKPMKWVVLASAAVGLLPGVAQAQSTPAGVMTWSYGYDAQGNRHTVVDPLGLTTNTQYDRLSRPTQVTQPLPATGVARPVIKQGWDQRDQAQSVTDPRNLVTSYVRSGLGDTSSQVSPDTGTTGASYNADGSVATVTDARGKVTSYGYDGLNRLISVSYPTGTGTVFEYDGGSVTPKPANSQGRLTKITDESGSTSYSYDGHGRVISKVQTVTSPASRSFTVGYGWGGTGTATGKLQTLSYPSGARLNLSYAADGRLSGLTVNVVNANGVGTSTTVQTLLSGLSYTAWNEPKGWSWGGGVSYARSWDSYGRAQSYPLGNPAGTGLAAGMTRTLGYDDAGRIKSYTHTRGTTAVTAADQAFGYDGLGRLITATQGATSYGYGYDASGNRLSYGVGSTTFTNQVSATSNRLSSMQRVSLTTGSVVTEVPVYDAAGHTTSNGSAGTAVYSDRGRLATSNVPVTGGTSALAYRYNGLEQRVSKAGALVSTGAAYYVHDEAGHLLGEYDASGIPLYEVVWLGDQPLGVIKQTRTGSGATLNVSTRLDYLYADHLNTPRVIVRGSDQAIVWRWDSTEPFGVTAANENPSALGAYPFNLRFPGQVYDRETTGHYNLNRDYSAWLGRYVQSDPIGLDGGINTYAYVEGNPVGDVDPLGLMGNASGASRGGSYQVVRGSGDTSICSYYDSMASKYPNCGYYKEAGKICRGQGMKGYLTNSVVKMGIDSTAASRGGITRQGDMLKGIRSRLIAADQRNRQAGNLDSNGCVCGNSIDAYHNDAFNGVGIDPGYYGGNRWFQSVWPNPVPLDPSASPYDLRRLWQ